MTISRRPPTAIPMIASLKPGITPLSWKLVGPESVQEASKTFPDHRAPTYWTVTLAFGPATVPLPTTRSLPVSLAGGAPAPAAMVGSLLRSVAPLTAGTEPAANNVVAGVDADAPDAAMVVVDGS